MTLPAVATVAAAVTLTPVAASSSPGISGTPPVSLTSATAPVDLDSILDGAVPEAFASGDSGVAELIEGVEELLHWPLELVEWPIGFVPIVGGVVNGVLESFWYLGVDLVNAPLIPAAEVLTFQVDLLDGLGDVGQRFVDAFVDFGEGLVDATGFPLPFAADADPSQFADASETTPDFDAGDGFDASDAFDAGVFADLF